MVVRSGWVLLAACAVAVVALGCRCARKPDRVDGVVDAPQPITAPVSKKPVCVVRLKGSYYAKAAQRTRHARSPARFAPDVTFEVDGDRLPVVGHGGFPMGFDYGETWSWRHGAPAPEELRGYDGDIDAVLRCTEPDANCAYRNIRFTEQYIPCGGRMSLRGKIEGDRFVLTP